MHGWVGLRCCRTMKLLGDSDVPSPLGELWEVRVKAKRGWMEGRRCSFLFFSPRKMGLSYPCLGRYLSSEPCGRRSLAGLWLMMQKGPRRSGVPLRKTAAPSTLFSEGAAREEVSLRLEGLPRKKLRGLTKAPAMCLLGGCDGLGKWETGGKFCSSVPNFASLQIEWSGMRPTAPGLLAQGPGTQMVSLSGPPPPISDSEVVRVSGPQTTTTDVVCF